MQAAVRERGEEAGAEEVVDVAQLRNVPEGEEAESRSIFVKNLAWCTRDSGLVRHFDRAISAAGGSLCSAKVALRSAPDGKSLSAGFGFLECSSEAVAKIVISKLQGSVLDGHKLSLQLSLKKPSAGGSTQAKTQKKKSDNVDKATKVVVRNVAFEATSKDVRALFKPFGQIKSVRLPKKFDNSHRSNYSIKEFSPLPQNNGYGGPQPDQGSKYLQLCRGFAFVDFLSNQEAVNAMESVAGTHLYGRRLVCEWANQSEEGLDELRAKAAAKLNS